MQISFVIDVVGTLAGSVSDLTLIMGQRAKSAFFASPLSTFEYHPTALQRHPATTHIHSLVPCSQVSGSILLTASSAAKVIDTLITSLPLLS